MSAPLTDDDLGARLRAALQDISPLATDPVPPPRFAPALEVEPAVVADGPPDLVVVGGGAGDRVPRRSRRRIAVAAGVLAAAAAAVVAVVATADTSGSGRTATVPAGPVTAPASPIPRVPAVVPPAGAVTAFPDVWRCTAPVGRRVTAALESDRTDSDQIWSIPAGVTCAARPDERGKYVFEPHGISVPGVSPAEVGGSDTCITGWSVIPVDGAITSRGPVDYLEFYGPGCYLVSADT